MAWFFRAVETDQGGWQCRYGKDAFDEHPTLDEAVEHLRSLARAQGLSFEVIVDFQDGWVRMNSLRAPEKTAPASPRLALHLDPMPGGTPVTAGHRPVYSTTSFHTCGLRRSALPSPTHPSGWLVGRTTGSSLRDMERQ